MAKKYYWLDEVKKIDWNLVELKDWVIVELTETQLGYMITNEPKDATQLKDVVVNNVIIDVMWLLEKHNVKKWYLDSILHWVWQTYNKHLLDAIGKLFGTYNEKEHYSHSDSEITMKHIKSALEG